ncbi:MAG: hypothetical protein NXI10_03635 [bacterium]|nr:hypothetical protein [bacterium]
MGLLSKEHYSKKLLDNHLIKTPSSDDTSDALGWFLGLSKRKQKRVMRQYGVDPAQVILDIPTLEKIHKGIHDLI